MATQKNALAKCDTCGFVYSHRIMRLNSYGLLVCPEDFEGIYDLKNHPQNKVPNVKDNPAIRNPRPDTGGRGITWDEYAEWITLDPQSLAPIIGNTTWQLANRTWDGI